MVALIRQRSFLRNPTFGRSKFIDALPHAPVSPAVAKLEAFSLTAARFDLTGVVISMTAANDFGGVQIADLANTNMLITGAMIDAVATMAGFASNVGTTLDIAIGSVTTASANFANAGEKAYLDKIDATGAGATATIKGHSFDNASPAQIFLDAASTNDLFLNGSSPVTSGTGTVTFTSGYLRLFYWDLQETS